LKPLEWRKMKWISMGVIFIVFLIGAYVTFDGAETVRVPRERVRNILTGQYVYMARRPGEREFEIKYPPLGIFLVGSAIAAEIALMILDFIFWKCPECDRYLGRLGLGHSHCSRCGASIEREE